MFCRAKISVLFTLVGALTALGALLNPEQRNTAFQPGGKSRFAKPAVWRPAEATIIAKHRAGASGKQITLGTKALVRVDLKGVTFTKAADATLAPPAVRQAGGSQ